MADEVDVANDSVERALQQAIARVRTTPVLPPKGSCYFCEEPLEPFVQDGKPVHRKLFCDRDCAEDWEREQKAKRLR